MKDARKSAMKGAALILCVMVSIVAGLSFAKQMREELVKPNKNPFSLAYKKLAEKSPLHHQVMEAYAPCSLAKGMWARSYDVIASDCMTKTMFEMDKLDLPRAELFGIQQDIRKAEQDLSERLIQGSRH